MRISDWSSDVCSSDLPRRWFRRARSYPSDLGEEDGEEGVEDDDEEDALDDRGGRAKSHLLGVALHLQPLEAAGHGDDEAEHGRLDERPPQVRHRHHLAYALDEGYRRDLGRDTGSNNAHNPHAQPHRTDDRDRGE